MGLNYTFAGQTGPISLSTLDTALGDASVGGFKNKIIGGDFTTNPWQRGTSFTAPATLAYTADRWRVSHVSDGVVNVLKTSDAPTAAQAGVYTQHCLHADVTTADTSLAAGQYWKFDHFVEGLNAASFGFGQSGTRNVTLSFWHKHTKTGVYCVALINSASNRSYVAEYTQDVTNTWEKATITIPVDTSGTWLYDTGVGVQVAFTMAAAGSGGTFTTTPNAWQAGGFFSTSNQVNALDNVANDFKIALVQLEAGSVATPFETRSVGQELALCQRYYYRMYGYGVADPIGVGTSASTTIARIISKFPVTMRISPYALDQSGVAADYNIFSNNTSQVCTSVPIFNTAGVDYADTIFTTGATQVLGQGAYGRIVSTSGYLGWSAEI